MNKKLSEKEIDALVVAQADDEDTWTIEYLKKRAERGNREKFLQALSKIPKSNPTKTTNLIKA